MLVGSKFSLLFVKKMKKLKLSLSKQHNKMLKIKSELLKMRKKCQNNQARKNFPQKLSGIFRIPVNPKIFGITGISRSSREIFLKFPVSPAVENLRKSKTPSPAVSRTFCRFANGPILLLFSSIGPLTSRQTIIENHLDSFIFNDTLKRFNVAN